MRVIHTIASLRRNAGGPTRTVGALCRELGRLGVDVQLLSVDLPHDSADTSVVPPRQWVTTTLVPPAFAAPAPPLAARAFKNALEPLCVGESVALIHDHGLWLPTNHAAAATARAHRVPLVISPRGMLEPWALGHHAWKKRLAWWAYQLRDVRSARLLHATSGQEMVGLRRLGLRQPIALIPNGVELAPLPNPFDRPDHAPRSSLDPSAPRTALFLSRIHPKKGLLELIEAWSLLRPANWRMVVAGPDEGGHRAVLEQRITDLGLAGQFDFVGAVDGAAKTALYQQAELFVLPTFSENFGVVVAEALASGVPVITTKGAPWQALETHRCGWWVAVGVEPLAAALKEAFAMPAESLAEMGARGRSFVEQVFAWPPLAAEMLAVYQWLLEQKQRPGCVHLD